MLFSRPYSYASLRLKFQISNSNLRTGILITGCMACGGGSCCSASSNAYVALKFIRPWQVQHLSLQSSNASQSSSIQVENLQNYFGSLFSGFSISNFVYFIEKVSVYFRCIFSRICDQILFTFVVVFNSVE